MRTLTRTRVIPVLLLRGRGLVKTTRFKDPRYVGDAINALRIFNDKEVDELVLLDIEATRSRRGPEVGYLEELAGECFMPLGYGGGLSTLGQIHEVVHAGIEKVALNTATVENPDLVGEAARVFGSSTIVASIDVRRGVMGGSQVVTRGGTVRTGRDPVAHAREMEGRGAGEILLTSIDRDGTQSGYELELVRRVAEAVSIPVIACGGAGCVAHLKAARRQAGASAVAAGSMFVFYGKHRAVLINVPPPGELHRALDG